LVAAAAAVAAASTTYTTATTTLTLVPLAYSQQSPQVRPVSLEKPGGVAEVRYLQQ